MAGEFNDVLDMSLLNFDPVEESPQIEEQEVQTENIEITNTADDESQEKVGEQGKEKALEKEEKENLDSPANSETVFKPLAEFLKEQGFFSDLELEIKNEDDLADAFRKEIKKNEFADLNEYQKQYLDSLREGVPDVVVQEHLRTQQVFENLTDEILEEEDIRKQVIIQDRLASGWSKERAEKDYDRIFNNGDSYEESKISRDNLIAKEKQEFQARVEQEKQSKVEADKAAKKQLEDLKQAVFKEENLFGAFKVDDGLKTRVHEAMIKVVDYTPEGLPLNKLMKHRVENPVDFETKLYYLYELTNGFKDINKFVSKSGSIAAKKLSEAVQNSTYIKSRGEGAKNFNDDPNDYSSPIVDIQL